MINPVNNNIPSAYQPQSSKVNAPEGSEQFSLKSALDKQDGQGGVIYESSSAADEKQKNVTAGEKNPSFAESLGKASLKDSKDNKEEAPDQITATANMLWENIKDFFESIWNNIKKIFGNLWDSKPISDGLEKIPPVMSPKDQGQKNDNSLTGVSSDEVSLEISASASDIEALEKNRDENIKKALKDGDKDLFRNLISEEGKKFPARNTDMLTTYNSKGMIREISPSDQNKILRGDRGARKL
ncbi:MAG: hypothetical protein IJ195_00855 [Lachnospiraceae bacterium]|nr:hypothetical protein [Lachnospiraceae bacterium]